MSTGRNSPVDVLQVINIIEQMEIDRYRYQSSSFLKVVTKPSLVD